MTCQDLLVAPPPCCHPHPAAAWASAAARWAPRPVPARTAAWGWGLVTRCRHPCLPHRCVMGLLLVAGSRRPEGLRKGGRYRACADAAGMLGARVLGLLWLPL